MKNLVFILLFIVNLVHSQEKKFLVVIDPGHGKHDSGTSTIDGIMEKDINLYVSKFIQSYCEEIYPEIDVVLTREEDVFIPLKKRPVYADVLDADLFISIHCNHNKNKKAKGLEIYIQSDGNKRSTDNYLMAHRYGVVLNEIMQKKLKYKSRGIKYQNFSVLRNSIGFVPSVLVELGFFSNGNEAKYLTSKKGINGVSLAIATSIHKYSQIFRE